LVEAAFRVETEELKSKVVVAEAAKKDLLVKLETASRAIPRASSGGNSSKDLLKNLEDAELKELRSKLQVLEERERERTTRLEALLARLQEEGEEDTAHDEDEECSSKEDSGVADSSETTGQSDSQEDDAPSAPVRPAWMEEAKTAEEARQRKLTGTMSPRDDKKKQLQGLLRRGAVFKEKEEKKKEEEQAKPSVAVEQHRSPAASPILLKKKKEVASSSSSPHLGAAPLSPKKKKGHLELNSIIAALTPKARRKDPETPASPVAASVSQQQQQQQAGVAIPPSSPRPTTRLGRSRSTGSGSPFLRKKTAVHEAEPVEPAVAAKRPNIEEGELMREKIVHEMKALEISVYQAVNLEDLGNKTVRFETAQGFGQERKSGVCNVFT
jgi:hypothetical protein